MVFSSDRGEMLGDHHFFRKSLGYEASSRVPFFISGYTVPITPGRERPRQFCLKRFSAPPQMNELVLKPDFTGPGVV